jgi:hypothetical protein
METWVRNVHDADVLFFVGGPIHRHHPETGWYVGDPPLEVVLLDVDDSYEGLPQKVQAIYRWALLCGYDAVLKLDDDVYCLPHLIPWSNDYVGNVRAGTGGYVAPYCSGFGYILSRKAMQVIADAPLTADPNEDRFVGNTLAAAGINPVHDPKNFMCFTNDPISIWRPDSVIGYTAVICLRPGEVRKCYQYENRWSAGYRKYMPLERANRLRAA